MDEATRYGSAYSGRFDAVPSTSTDRLNAAVLVRAVSAIATRISALIRHRMGATPASPTLAMIKDDDAVDGRCLR